MEWRNNLETLNLFRFTRFCGIICDHLHTSCIPDGSMMRNSAKNGAHYALPRKKEANGVFFANA
jgi:hypothetical protein